MILRWVSGELPPVGAMGGDDHCEDAQRIQLMIGGSLCVGGPEPGGNGGRGTGTGRLLDLTLPPEHSCLPPLLPNCVGEVDFPVQSGPLSVAVCLVCVVASWRGGWFTFSY